MKIWKLATFYAADLSPADVSMSNNVKTFYLPAASLNSRNAEFAHALNMTTKPVQSLGYAVKVI